MQTYLQITLKVADKNREAAAGVYKKYGSTRKPVGRFQ